MELDHVFLFIEKPELVARVLGEFGITEGSPNVHPGQGTACRRFFFQNVYLELASVINETEIKAEPIAKTRLWKDRNTTLLITAPLVFVSEQRTQGSNSITSIFKDSWHYHSPFLSGGEFVNVASNENFPAEPMLFEMPFFRKSPKEYSGQKRQPLMHQKGFKEITKLRLDLPTSIENL